MNRLVWVFFLTVFLALVSFVPGQLFRIRNLECRTQFGTCDPDQLHQFSNLIGLPLLFVTPPTVPPIGTINKINFIRKWPSTLAIDLILSRNIGSFTTANIQQLWLVSDTGKVSSPTTQTTLPLLTISQTPAPGSQASPWQTQAFFIMSDPVLLQFGRPLGQLVSSSLTIILSPQLSVILDITKTQSDWQKALQSIINRSKINGRQPAIIDLRYTSPVVTYH